MYRSPIDDRPITSMASRREDLARSGCVEYDPEMKTDRIRNIKRDDEAIDKAVDETVESAVANMSSRQLEKLGEEFLRGADVAPVRS